MCVSSHEENDDDADHYDDDDDDANVGASPFQQRWCNPSSEVITVTMISIFTNTFCLTK